LRIGNRNTEHIGDKDYVIRSGVKLNYLRYITKRENIANGVCANGEAAAPPEDDTVTELSVDEKKRILSESNAELSRIFNDILKKFLVSILSNESKNVYKKITGSLKNEMKQFNEYKQVYEHKLKSDDKTLNVMKHEMIHISGIIHFLSVTFLILSILLFVYIYIDSSKYNNLFGAIVVILLLFNLYHYYYTILHPVRTQAKNKYWYALDENKQQIIS